MIHHPPPPHIKTKPPGQHSINIFFSFETKFLKGLRGSKWSRKISRIFSFWGRNSLKNTHLIITNHSNHLCKKTVVDKTTGVERLRFSRTELLFLLFMSEQNVWRDHKKKSFTFKKAYFLVFYLRQEKPSPSRPRFSCPPCYARALRPWPHQSHRTGQRCVLGGLCCRNIIPVAWAPRTDARQALELASKRIQLKMQTVRKSLFQWFTDSIDHGCDKQQQLLTTGLARLKRFPKYLNRVHSPLPLYYLLNLLITPQFPGLSFEQNQSTTVM